MKLYVRVVYHPDFGNHPSASGFFKDWLGKCEFLFIPAQEVYHTNKMMMKMRINQVFTERTNLHKDCIIDKKVETFFRENGSPFIGDPTQHLKKLNISESDGL